MSDHLDEMIVCNQCAEKDAEIARLTKGWESAGETWDWILGDIWKALTAAGHPSDGKSGPKEKVVELAERLTQAEGAIAERDAEIERLREEISEYDDERSEHQDERTRMTQEIGCLSLAHGGLFTRISNLLERLEMIERLKGELAKEREQHNDFVNAAKHVLTVPQFQAVAAQYEIMRAGEV